MTNQKPIATFRPQALFMSHAITLWPDRIERRGESHPLDGVSAQVEASGSAVSGYRGITIAGPDFAWTKRIASTSERKAHKFAATVNLAARQASARRPEGSGPMQDTKITGSGSGTSWVGWVDQSRGDGKRETVMLDPKHLRELVALARAAGVQIT